MADYYEILGVSRDAPSEEIKKTFRRLARESHPDANPGDADAEARFRQYAEAYEVLSDPNKRARYDRGDAVDFGDLFSGLGSFDGLLRSVFGDGGVFGGARRAAEPRGRDIRVRLEVDLEEAAFGSVHDVEFRAAVACDTCRGSGARPGSHSETCGTCGGAGQVRVARRSMLGSVMTVTACGTCGGAGQVIPDPCETCEGAGVTEAVKSVSVEVPQGVAQGTRLRLNGDGEAGARGAPGGDLYVDMVVLPNELFDRQGDDLVYTLDLGIAQATLGAKADVPLLGGGVERVGVKPGTQPGEVLRLKGEGVGHLGRRGRGDLFVRVNVDVPTSLSAAEREMLRRFAEARGEQISD